jgi:Glycosyl transferase family 2
MLHDEPRHTIMSGVMSIVVPAHNEAQVIGRLLGMLTSSAGEDLDIVVVANGCTDNTAEVASRFSPRVRVLTVPAASKREALAAGNRSARGFPRLYIDADVEIKGPDVQALGAALRRPGVLAAGPELTNAVSDRPWLIRWYYDVWTRLPEVRRGLFGRGVVGVSEAGYVRIAALPPVLADDLTVSLAFTPDERVIVAGAKVTVHAPRTVADLLRVRTRAAMGTRQIEQTEGTPAATSRTRPGDLIALVRSDLRMAPRVAWFLSVAVAARWRARRLAASHGYGIWLRDDSSRQQAADGTSAAS